MKKIKQIVLVVVLFAVGFMAGCGTVSGLGNDVGCVGRGITYVGEGVASDAQAQQDGYVQD